MVSNKAKKSPPKKSASKKSRSNGAAGKNVYDLIVIGGGTAGMPAAAFAASKNANVLIIDAADRLGGTLYLSTGQMSAAGTKLQRDLGINDTPDAHFDDIMRISSGTADPMIARLAVDNAAPAFEWLIQNGFTPLPGHPVMGQGHEFYSQKRYYWGAELGVSLVKVLDKALSTHIARGFVTVLTNTRAQSLIMKNGRVAGVVSKDASGKTVKHMGRAVAITTGGYASNREMFKKLNNRTQYARMSYKHAQGDGLTMAQKVGAALQGHDKYLCGLGSIMMDDQVPSIALARMIHFPQYRPPWEIYVNARGERWINEDNPSVDKREHALLDQPDLRFWVIADAETHAQAPVPVVDWSRERFTEAFGKEKLFYKADTLEELAKKAGIDVKGLKKTVEAYNEAQRTGKDPLGRKFMPRPVVKAPFYAFRHQGSSISSTVGLAVNDKLQVLRKNGKPIAGLYAAGEAIGAGMLMGQSFCGGMLVMPAITFGKLIGERVHTL